MAKTVNWTRGHIKFRREAKKYKSLREFWHAVGVEIGTGSRIYRGLLTPTIRGASKLQQATKGRIKVTDWDVAAEAPEELAA